MEEKNKKLVLGLIILSVLLLVIGGTYAFIELTLTGEKKQTIVAGTLSLELLEDNNNLTITDALPMYDDVGMLQEPFTFRLVNKGTSSANYVLKLVDITTGDKLSTSDVKYGLTKEGLKTIGLVSEIEDGVIDSGTIAGNNTIINYELRLWIREGVASNPTISGKSLSYKLNVEVGQIIEEEVPVGGIPALYAENGTVIKTWEELVADGSVTVEGTTLTDINISEGYRLLVPGTIKTFTGTYEWRFGFNVLEFQNGLETVNCTIYGRSTIEKIIFPDTVTHIDSDSSYVFKNCPVKIIFKGVEYDFSSERESADWDGYLETIDVFNALPEIDSSVIGYGFT